MKYYNCIWDFYKYKISIYALMNFVGYASFLSISIVNLSGFTLINILICIYIILSTINYLFVFIYFRYNRFEKIYENQKFRNMLNILAFPLILNIFTMFRYKDSYNFLHIQNHEYDEIRYQDIYLKKIINQKRNFNSNLLSDSYIGLLENDLLFRRAHKAITRHIVIFVLTSLVLSFLYFGFVYVLILNHASDLPFILQYLLYIIILTLFFFSVFSIMIAQFVRRIINSREEKLLFIYSNTVGETDGHRSVTPIDVVNNLLHNCFKKGTITELTEE